MTGSVISVSLPKSVLLEPNKAAKIVAKELDKLPSQTFAYVKHGDIKFAIKPLDHQNYNLLIGLGIKSGALSQSSNVPFLQKDVDFFSSSAGKACVAQFELLVNQDVNGRVYNTYVLSDSQQTTPKPTLPASEKLDRGVKSVRGNSADAFRKSQEASMNALNAAFKGYTLD